MKKIMLMFVGLMILTASPVLAHFQMVYTPESALQKGDTVPFKVVFTHPFEAGHTMDMGTPEGFVVVHKGKKQDIKNLLEPITWTSLTNAGKAYEFSYKLRGMGDWVFGFSPAPYYEGSEDAYIQQFTKVIVNVAGAPTDWDAMLGLPAEIMPLTKPYSIWAGSTFTGVVMGNGKPVPFAEIEVEYLNHAPEMDKNAFAKKAEVEAPQDSFVTMGIKADANGEFTFGIPRAGWWGFAALGAGPETSYKGKDLSQDAVIWVQAKEMK
jgi:cobalt/nickel transport protein